MVIKPGTSNTERSNTADCIIETNEDVSIGSDKNKFRA